MAKESRVIDKTFDETFEEIFTIQKNISKLKHAIKKQNLQNFRSQLFDFIAKKKIALRDGGFLHGITFDSLFQDVARPTLVFNELLRFLKEAKSKRKEPLILEKDIRNILVACELEGLMVRTKLSKAMLYEEGKRLGEAMLKYFIFLQTQCYMIENRKLKDVDNIIYNIGEHCVYLARISLRLNDIDTSKKYFQWLKRIIKIYPQIGVIEKTEHLREYYEGMAYLAILDNDYTQAKEYALTAVDHDDFIDEKHSQLGKPYQLNLRVVELCEMFMRKTFVQNELDQTLFWAKLAKNGCEKIIKFREEKIIYKNCCVVTGEEDLKAKLEIRKEYGKKKDFFEVAISQTKPKILNKNIDLITQAFNDEKINAQFKINYVKDGNKMYPVLNIKLEDCDSIFLLLKALKANNIICSNDKKNQAINIYDLHYIDTKALLRALKNCKNEISRNLEIKLTSDALYQAPLIPVQKILPENNTILEETADEKPVSKNKLKKKVENRPEQTPNTLEQKPKTKPNKTIDWGEGYPIYEKNSANCHFFKLRGPTAIRHYLYIKPELYEEISQKNPLMARNLLRICDRGKVINKSQGKKGIIVREQEQEKVKIKDSSKDYRFFGDVVRSIKMKDDKTYTLVEINSYKLTHKQKIATKL